MNYGVEDIRSTRIKNKLQFQIVVVFIYHMINGSKDLFATDFAMKGTFKKPKNPKWTKQGKKVSLDKPEADKLDVGKASKTSKKVLSEVGLSDDVFESAASVPMVDMGKLADFSSFMEPVKKGKWQRRE